MSNNDIVYLDYAATTPLDARVARRISELQSVAYGNPASNHAAGRQSLIAVERAAQQLGHLLNADPESFIWTSGATESNNLAIAGAAKQRRHRGRHLVTMRTEHKAVVDVFQALEKQGFDVTWLDPDSDGRLSVGAFTAALQDDTQLASIMHINNETGVVQDIAALGAACRERGVLFHVDAAQSVGKVRINLQELPVDLLSLTAHKFYGPKGVGALYIAGGTVIEPIFYGGGQQRRLRPGTLPVDLIGGLGETAEIAAASIESELQRLGELGDSLRRGLQELEGLQVNGDPDNGYPGIINVGVAGVEGESLMLMLAPLCVAAGSACNSQSREPSYVLRALGRSDLEAQSAIRFSLGRQTTMADIEFAVTRYRQSVTILRRLAPQQPQ